MHYKINEIAKQFEPEALPLDFINSEPIDDLDPINDNYLFIKQLHEIAVDTKRIEHAIKDFYKAFEQRSRWARKNLLIDNEIELYEKRLVGEWERFSLAVQDEMGDQPKDNIYTK